MNNLRCHFCLYVIPSGMYCSKECKIAHGLYKDTGDFDLIPLPEWIAAQMTLKLATRITFRWVLLHADEIEAVALKTSPNSSRPGWSRSAMEKGDEWKSRMEQ